MGDSQGLEGMQDEFLWRSLWLPTLLGDSSTVDVIKNYSQRKLTSDVQRSSEKWDTYLRSTDHLIKYR